MPKAFLMTLTLLAVFVAGFSMPAEAGNSEFVGTLLGAGAGGYLGNQFGHGAGNVAATTAGVFVGGAVGNQIGHAADRTSQPAPVYYNSYNSYQPAPLYYAPAYVPNYVAPPDIPPTYIDGASQNYCREYSELVRVGNQLRESYGTACLEPDGTWRVQE